MRPMPVSKQDPLSAQRGGDARDFGQPRLSWEVAAFDQAQYFACVNMARRGETRRYVKFAHFPWAARYARGQLHTCVYAVTESGRFALLDREKWVDWETRWWEMRSEHTPLSDT